MNRAAFKASYSDWKLIKTRSVVQIVFEVPLEAADDAYQVLNGMPDFGSEQWFAIARLHPEAKEQEPAREQNHPGQYFRVSRKRWHEMSGGQQSGMLAGDPIFQKFIYERYPAINVFNTGTDKERVAEFIRAHCSVKSRADILPGTKADKLWRDLVSEYRAWVAQPAVVA